MNEDTPSVVIERTVDAPVELVWQMWTDEAHFAAWYGPDGARIPTARMDVRVGGRRLIGMELDTPNGPMSMFFTGEYVEIVDGHRLVYTEAMADAEGNAIAPEQMGMPAGHPPYTEVRVELEDLDGSTRMVVTHVGVPADSPGAAGWNMALDKLVARVTQPPVQPSS